MRALYYYKVYESKIVENNVFVVTILFYIDVKKLLNSKTQYRQIGTVGKWQRNKRTR